MCEVFSDQFCITMYNSYVHVLVQYMCLARVAFPHASIVLLWLGTATT